MPITCHTSFPLIPASQKLLIYFLIINLFSLDISYTWNDMCLFCLPSFTQHNVFNFHQLRMYQYFIPFLWPNNIPLFDQTTFCLYLSVSGHLGCCHFLTLMSNTTMIICVQFFVWAYVFSSCEYIPAAAAKSLQLCLTPCDPIDGSAPGSPVPGILLARTQGWNYWITW